jgi:hypothetical protein
MPECPLIVPGNVGVGQSADGSWQYERLHGAAPQGAAPWSDGPAVPESREPASVVADASPTPADRLALALCVAVLPGSKPCNAPCNACRVNSAAVAHEIARQFRERHGGSSQVADWLDGVGCHAPGAGQSVHP